MTAQQKLTPEQKMQLSLLMRLMARPVKHREIKADKQFLANVSDLQNEGELESALASLCANGLIETFDSGFLITAKGEEWLRSQVPFELPRSDGDEPSPP